METPLLAILDLVSPEPISVIQLEGVRDPHSIAFYQNHIYITSTGTNEIHRVSVNGRELGEQELYWRYPGVGQDADEIHLNGIAAAEDGLIATCFGPKTGDGSWGMKGRLFYVDPFAPIRERLRQPHSPTILDGKLYFAESGDEKVYVCERADDGAWQVVKDIRIGGYTRGITRLGDRIVVGISEKRRVSRSKNTIVDEEIDLKTAELRLVNTDTGTVEPLFDLAAFAREVYDIVPVDGVFAFDTQLEALKIRVHEMESTVEQVRLHARMWNDKLLARDLALHKSDKKSREMQLELKMIRAPFHWFLTEPFRIVFRLMATRLDRGTNVDLVVKRK